MLTLLTILNYYIDMENTNTQNEWQPDPLQGRVEVNFCSTDLQKSMRDISVRADAKVRERSVFSPLIEIGPIPAGVGFHFRTEVLPAKKEEQSGNSASSIMSYSIQSTLLQSDNFQRENEEPHVEMLLESVADLWSQKDVETYSSYCFHKLCATSSGFEMLDGIDPKKIMALEQPMMDIIYTRLAQEGGLNESVGHRNGSPLALLVGHMGRLRLLKKEFGCPTCGRGSEGDDFTITDPKFEEFAKSRNITKAHGSWVHIYNQKARRFRFEDGELMEIPFFTNVQMAQGTALIVNAEYQKAKFEESLVLNLEVMKRLVEDTALPFGDATWVPKGKPEDEEFDPSFGRVAIPLMAAWQPVKTQFGYSILSRIQ